MTKRTVSGLGIVFNSESANLGGFRETILPQAADNLIETCDIVFLLNHNYDRGVLARSTFGKGSLKLQKTKKGLEYEFTAPQTGCGPELLENLERGEINASSFSFNIAAGGETWLKRKDDYLRTISKISALYDISAVYRAAYTATSCEARSMDDTWRARQSSAERSGSPKEQQFKTVNVLNLLNLKEGDTVVDTEIDLFINELESRDIKIPASPPSTLSRTEIRNFQKAYANKGSDVKPEIKKWYMMSAEDQSLYDANQRLKRGI